MEHYQTDDAEKTRIYNALLDVYRNVDFTPRPPGASDVVHHAILDGTPRVIVSGNYIYTGKETMAAIREEMNQTKGERIFRKIFKRWLNMKSKTIEISYI